MPELVQPSLTGGEISPSLYGRVDLARYATSLRTCRNWIVRPYGGVETRSGTMFVSEVKDSNDRVLLVDFQFSTQQAYVLEFGDGYMRVIKNGGLLTPAGSPAWDIGTAYLADDYVTYGGETYRALGATTGDQPDISPSDWQQTDIYEIASPYALADLDLLKWTQSADVLTLVHPDYPPYELRRSAELDWEFVEFEYRNGPFRDTNTDETVTVYASAASGTVTLTASDDIFNANHVGALFYLEQRDLSGVVPWEPDKRLAGEHVNVLGLLRRSDGKVYECVTDYTSASGKNAHTGTVRPVHSKGVASDGDGNAISGTDTRRAGVDWLYVHSGYGIARITGYTSPTEVTAEVLTEFPSSVVGGSVTAAGPWTGTGDGVTTTLSIAGATSSKPSDYRVTLDDVVVSASAYTVNATTDILTFDVAPGNTVAIYVEQLALNNSSYVWAFGAWSEDQGYPRAVAYFGDRLWFGGTTGQPATVWASKVSNYTDFGVSTPLVDDDSITATINSRLVNEIRDIVALSNLVLLTSGAEWVVTAGQDDVITPSTIGFKPQSYRGSADLQARVVGNTAIYVQERGQNLRDLAYSFESDAYAGTDLTLLADHLFRGYTIVGTAFQQIPWSVIWAVRSDGILLGMTYQRDQEVVGWHRHDTDGTVERVCCIPEDDEDALYLLVKRTVNGSTVRYIERLSTRLWTEDNAIFCVDSGLTYDGTNTDPGITVTLSGGTDWTVTEDLTLTAAGGLTFTTDDIGDQIWLDPLGSDTRPLKLTIIARTSPTVVTVQAERDVIADYRNVALSGFAFAHDTISGLGHLEGKSVAAVADGNDLGDFTVASGAITMPLPGAVVHVGLVYTCDAEPLDVNLAGAQSIRSRPKIIPKVGILVQDTRGLKVGRDAAHLDDVKQRDDEFYDDPVAQRTGLFEVQSSSSWGSGTRFLIRQDRPLPATILSLMPEVEIGGR